MNCVYIDGLSSVTRTALKENGELTEIIYDEKSDFSVGNIYIGRVARVLKGQFIFVNIGDEKNAFLQPDLKKEPSIFNDKGEVRLKEGDSLLVQLDKPAFDEKGAVVTTRLSFTGKYCVVIAGDRGVGVSKKITDNTKRAELKELAAKIIPADFGVIMRTDCQNIDAEVLTAELKGLLDKAKSVLDKAAYVKPPCLIYEDISKTVRIVRDLALDKQAEVITNSSLVSKKIKKELNLDIKLYDEPIPLFTNYGIESGIEKALHRRIWLKSGGYLIFDYTEALNVIDVNSGKHTGKRIKDFALKVNLEAADEAAKQIRLRNLTGMIIIDFIDMPSENDVERVSSRLQQQIAFDRVPTALVGMTRLGLMQLTRKKNGLPLHKIVMRDCPVCGGSGLTENELYITDKVINELIALFSQTIYNVARIKSSPALTAALKRHTNQLKVIEGRFNSKIIIEEISTGKLYYYELTGSKSTDLC